MIVWSRQFVSLLLAVLILFPASVFAENLLMIRTDVKFQQAINVVRDSVESHGYKVAHLQKCDGGLTGLGYKTDFYRVLFFAKPQEVRSLSHDYPELIPFLPLKMAIYAENDDTIISVYNPQEFKRLFPNPELNTQFDRWESDLRSILDEVLSTEIETPVATESETVAEPESTTTIEDKAKELPQKQPEKASESAAPATDKAPAK